MGERRRKDGRVDTWDKEIFQLRPVTTNRLVQEPGVQHERGIGARGGRLGIEVWGGIRDVDGLEAPLIAAPCSLEQADFQSAPTISSIE